MNAHDQVVWNSAIDAALAALEKVRPCVTENGYGDMEDDGWATVQDCKDTVKELRVPVQPQEVLHTVGAPTPACPHVWRNMSAGPEDPVWECIECGLRADAQPRETP